jgi:hypothetical protein
VYSGTRLRFTILYALFHAISAVVILTQFLAFGNLASNYWNANTSSSNDNNALVPISSTTLGDVPANYNIDMYNSISTTHNDTTSFHNASSWTHDQNYYWRVDAKAANHEKVHEIIQSRIADDEIKQYDLIWILLTLSLLSIGLHVVILLHVRSTAPTNDALKRKFEDVNGSVTVSQSDYGNYSDQKKRLGYWIYHQFKKGNSDYGMMEEMLCSDGLSQSRSLPLLKRNVLELDEEKGEGHGQLNDLHHQRDVVMDNSEHSHSDLESGLSVGSFLSDSEMDPFLYNEELFERNDHHLRRGLNRRRTSSGGMVNLGKLMGLERCFSTYSRGGCKSGVYVLFHVLFVSKMNGSSLMSYIFENSNVV